MPRNRLTTGSQEANQDRLLPRWYAARNIKTSELVIGAPRTKWRPATTEMVPRGEPGAGTHVVHVFSLKGRALLTKIAPMGGVATFIELIEEYEMADLALTAPALTE